MTITFKKAPLVELIAELRWGDATPIQPNAPLLMHGMGPDLDQFFISFGGEVYQHGFQRAERLIPSGLPVFPFQPTFRYRKDAAADNSVVFQLGSGLFSANATPPYHSWKTISEIVGKGVESLLKVRPQGEKNKPFSVLSLRYINAFGPELTRGQNVADFIRDVLGFSIRIPDVITAKFDPNSPVKPQIQFTSKLDDGTFLSCLVGEGTVNNETRAIMDMTVTNTQSISPDSAVVMASFTNARNFIHRIFVGLTQPIYDLLEPVGDDHAN